MRIYYLIFLVFISGETFAQAPSNIEKKVLETELARFRAMTTRDTNALQKMLHPDLVYLHSNGVQESKQQHLTAITAGTIVYQAMVREPDPTIRLYGKLALVNGRVRVSGTFRSNSFSVLLLYTAVYRKQNRRWLLLNWQSTKVDPE